MRIGHAKSDEHKKARGGAAGDQTGEEILVERWYDRTGGWEVYLECKDEYTADKAASLMEEICENPSFGYDQGDRKTGYTAILKAGSVDEAEPSEFDCSSLVCACYKLAGLDIDIVSTHTLEKEFLKTGLFTASRDYAVLEDGEWAKRGGIYLTAGKHVAMALDDGLFREGGRLLPNTPESPVEAHEDKASTDPKPVTENGSVRVLGASVRVRALPTTESDTLGIAHKGEVLARVDGWHSVRYGGGIGFISARKDLTVVE